MIKNKNLLIWLTTAFLCVESALGALLQTTENSVSVKYRYAVVILACLFCFILADRSWSYLFTQIALIFTVCSDYYLVYLPVMRQLPAMKLFSIAQIAYFLRLITEDDNPRRRRVHIILRISLSAIAVAVAYAVLGVNADPLVPISLFYYINLILNTVFAFVSIKKNPLLAIGCLLFLLCDTVIGLPFIKTYLPSVDMAVIDKLINPGFYLNWAFYTPSQMLLAISMLPKRLGREK